MAVLNSVMAMEDVIWIMNVFVINFIVDQVVISKVDVMIKNRVFVIRYNLMEKV